MVNKKRTLKALRAITDGFIALTNEFEGQEEVEQEVPEEVAQDSEVEERVELDSMSYADLKELAKELGVTAKGDRDTVQKAIADYYDSKGEETEDEEQEEMSEDAEEEEEEEDIFEEETSDEEEEPVDDTESKVNEAVADMSDEDIADFLADAGISPKGKRQALIAKVVKAVEDGIISLDDSEEEETDDTEDTSENEEETEDSEEDSEEESGEELSSREKAIEKLEKDFVEKNEKGEELNPEISGEILKAYNFATEKELSKMSDKDILNKLVDSAKYFVGDDCERHIGEGNDPYTINDVPYCCGHKLKKQQGNVYKCEVCNTEYEAEEE